jgi:hypothetical protein
MEIGWGALGLFFGPAFALLSLTQDEVSLRWTCRRLDTGEEWEAGTRNDAIMASKAFGIIPFIELPITWEDGDPAAPVVPAVI